RVFVNEEDVSDKIRTPEVSMGSSAVSAIPKVRDFLFELQRKIAQENDVIMDGRDIGTVVLPNADLKIFVTATPEERAKRRYNELRDKENSPTYEKILADIQIRDYNDSSRAVAPLKQADDAILFDTTGLGLEDSINKVIEMVGEMKNQ
ncbi:MAG TPA: (d)CMP kinase, partial [Clostridiales bacterium]|nr:(d)CMP kinase [Clostridiales bacterium]